MRVLGIDFETTGLDAKVDRVIEVGAVLWCTERNKPLRLLSETVQCTVPITAFIQTLTGIDPDMLTEAIAIPEVMAVAAIGDMISLADYYCAHNAPFDRGFLEAMTARHAAEVEAPFDKPWIDTKTDLPTPIGRDAKSLKYMAADHGFVSTFQHRALFDVMTMLRILSMYPFDQVQQLAASPTCTLLADASFEDNGVLREHGFYWDKARRSWRRQVKECQLASLRLPFLVRRDETPLPASPAGMTARLEQAAGATAQMVIDTSAADAAALGSALGRRFR
jgi:DNA polymerase III subunit epsilon